MVNWTIKKVLLLSDEIISKSCLGFKVFRVGSKTASWDGNTIAAFELHFFGVRSTNTFFFLADWHLAKQKVWSSWPALDLVWKDCINQDDFEQDLVVRASGVLKHEDNWLYLTDILFPLSSMCRIAPCLDTYTVCAHTWPAGYSLCSQVSVFFWSTDNLSETSVLQSSYLCFWGTCFLRIVSHFSCGFSEVCSSGRCDSTHLVLPIVCQVCWQPAISVCWMFQNILFCCCNYSLTWKWMHLVPCVTGELFWQQCFSWTLGLGMNM